MAKHDTIDIADIIAEGVKRLGVDHVTCALANALMTYTGVFDDAEVTYVDKERKIEVVVRRLEPTT